MGQISSWISPRWRKDDLLHKQTCCKAQITADSWARGSYMQELFLDKEITRANLRAFPCSLKCLSAQPQLTSGNKVSQTFTMFWYEALTSYSHQLWGQTLKCPCHEESCLGISQQSSYHSAQNPEDIYSYRSSIMSMAWSLLWQNMRLWYKILFILRKVTYHNINLFLVEIGHSEIRTRGKFDHNQSTLTSNVHANLNSKNF